jgi:hypothetical protein
VYDRESLLRPPWSGAGLARYISVGPRRRYGLRVGNMRARRAGILGVCTWTDPDGLLVELIEYAPGILGSVIDDLERRDS